MEGRKPFTDMKGKSVYKNVCMKRKILQEERDAVYKIVCIKSVYEKSGKLRLEKNEAKFLYNITRVKIVGELVI